jgi:CBS domain-containing protein
MGDGALLGAFSRIELIRALGRVDAQQPVLALIDPEVAHPHVHADHSIEDALERMLDAETGAIAVLDRVDIGSVTGIVTLEDVRAAFGFKA